MANVPLNTRFVGISPNVNLEEKKSSVLNSDTQPYTMQDIVDTVGSGSSAIKAVQVTITESEILNASGFSKTLISPSTGKVLVPISLSLYRKTGGTNYSISNSVRLNTINGSSSSTIGNAVDTPFTSSTVATLSNTYTFSINSNVVAGNSLKLVSGSASSPSVITGGTGDLIAYVSYVEIDVA